MGVVTRREGVGAQMRDSGWVEWVVRNDERARLPVRRGWSWGDPLSSLPGTVLVVMLKVPGAGKPHATGGVGP